jgi:ABC-type phosphate transport system permease subunit
LKLGREVIIKNLFLACASISIFAVLLIFLFIFRESLPAIRGAGFSNLFLSSTWSPANGHYGMLGFLLGTLVTTFFAMLIGAPLGIGTAIFIDQVAPQKIGR